MSDVQPNEAHTYFQDDAEGNIQHAEETIERVERHLEERSDDPDLIMRGLQTAMWQLASAHYPAHYLNTDHERRIFELKDKLSELRKQAVEELIQ